MEETELKKEDDPQTSVPVNESAAAAEEAVAAETENAPHEQEKPKTGLQKFLQFLKFTAFSASAAIIQLLTEYSLYEWTGLLPKWGAYPIGLTLSVIWNFTCNRKVTFKASSNVPIAMCLVVLYNLIIVVPCAILDDYLARLWGYPLSMLSSIIVLLINFATEFPWDKFIVFNDKIINKLSKTFSRKKQVNSAAESTNDATPTAEVCTDGQTEESPEDSAL